MEVQRLARLAAAQNGQAPALTAAQQRFNAMRARAGQGSGGSLLDQIGNQEQQAAWRERARLAVEQRRLAEEQRLREQAELAAAMEKAARAAQQARLAAAAEAVAGRAGRAQHGDGDEGWDQP